MKKGFIRTILATCALAICGTGFAVSGVNSYTVSANTANDFACKYAASGKDEQYVYYGSTELKEYTAEEAAAAGIPAGYEGKVFEVVHSEASKGFLADFTALQIPVRLVNSLNVRVYIEKNNANTNGKPQVRIPNPNDLGNAWVHQPGNTATPHGEWTTVVIENSGSKFDPISIDGYLGKMELAVRSNAKVAFYVDSISYTLKANDGVAPALSYSGDDVIYTNENAQFKADATAYDAQEQREIAIEYVWADPTVVNADGTLQKGTHALTLRAEDYYGNVSEKSLTVVVEEADLESPVIHINASTVYATIGTKPIVEFVATDNSKVDTQGYVWSAGALDVRGRLTEGTHTLTLFAEDRSGNRTEKVITYYVTETGDPEDNVVDEEEACKPVEPETPDVSEEPDVPATSEEPVEPPVSEEPDEPATSEEPVDPPVSEEPDVPATSEAPDVPATSEEPVEPPISEEPDVPATSEPTTSAPETESKKKGGCGGFTAIGTMAAMALAGVALLKKKEE